MRPRGKQSLEPACISGSLHAYPHADPALRQISIGFLCFRQLSSFLSSGKPSLFASFRREALTFIIHRAKKPIASVRDHAQ
jgi:hypothetical protein